MRTQQLIGLLAFVLTVTLANVSPAAEDSGNLALEEITVTAQKRAENLQDVPSAISAFGAQDIENSGWGDIDQLQIVMPSVVIGGEDNARPYIYIRGIGTSKFDIGSDSSIGIFVDEVFSARVSNNLTGILDLERIEVLKGPQGTLYGRNTLGGTISMYTKKPGNEPEGKVRAGVGNDGYYLVSSSMSGALIKDKLLARLSLASSDADGPYVDTVSGKTDNNRNRSARLTLLATPSDQFEITLTAETSKVESDAVLTEPLDGIIGFVNPFLDFDDVVADNKSDRFSNAFSLPGHFDIDSNQVSLKLKWFGDSVDFTSISSRSDEEFDEVRDFDGSTPDTFHSFVEQSSTQYSQELRFNSTDGGLFAFKDRLHWVAGVFYYTDDASRTDGFNFGPDSFLAPPPPLFPGLTHNNSSVLVEVDTTSLAIYGQATYAITSRLGLTLGLRYTDDEKKFTYEVVTNTPGFPIAFANFKVGDTLNFSSTDPRIALDYQLTEDVMVYASYSTGFKSGGVQFAVFVPSIALTPFDEEKLAMTELGIKSRFWGGRMQLNAALYRYDYKDQQVQSIIDVGGAPAALTQNAGESTMTGVEVEMVALLTEDLTVNFNYTYQDAEFNKFDSLAGSLAGNRMPRTPEYAASFGFNYVVGLGSAGDLNFQGNYTWKDDYYFNFENTVGTDSYGLVNLSAWWNSADHKWRLRAFCNNCSSEEYLNMIVTFPVTLGGGGRETWNILRRYGLELTYSF